MRNVILLGKGFERRYFYNPTSKLFQRGIRVERIVLWGACNYACPYCKREVNFVGDDGRPISTRGGSLAEIADFIHNIDADTEMLRVSGGDPVTMPLDVWEFIRGEAAAADVAVSVATNMSSRPHVERVYTQLDYVAGDFKGTPRYWEKVTSRSLGYLERTIRNWQLLLQSDVEAEARIPVFPFTTADDIDWIVRRLVSVRTNGLAIVLRNYSPVSWLDWEPTNPEFVLAQAYRVATTYNVNVVARMRWRTRTVWYRPDGTAFSVSPSGDLKLWEV